MSTGGEVLILDAREVQSILAGQERQVVEIVRAAYTAHFRGESTLPHSTFLNFPGRARDRIIALPAFLSGEFDVAGLKWIASFPENTRFGMDRASAVVILNSLESGRPRAIMEGGLISAQRTAASAALASSVLARCATLRTASLVGCGPINYEIARFLSVVHPKLRRLVLYDLDPSRADLLCTRLEALLPAAEIRVAPDLVSALSAAPLVSFATSAVEPYVSDLATCQGGTTVLHISLRDITPECVLQCDNVADDVDHVCRARTSLHLAEHITGSRTFIRCTLGEVLAGVARPRDAHQDICVFSPFGLGILDLALADWVAARAAERRMGTRVQMFPSPGECVPEAVS